MATRLHQRTRALPALVEQRAARRYPVLVSRDNGSVATDQPSKLVLRDISTYGCRLVTEEAFALGDRVRLSVANADAIIANIVWSDEGVVGCRFEKPLARPIMRALSLGIYPD